MRPLIWLAAFAAVLCLAPSTRAQNYPWCANFADGAGVNCGFSTYEQCMRTSQGSGGYCTKNNLYVAPQVAPSRAAARKRHVHNND